MPNETSKSTHALRPQTKNNGLQENKDDRCENQHLHMDLYCNEIHDVKLS